MTEHNPVIQLINMMILNQPPLKLRARYKNYRGVTSYRIFSPIRLWHGKTEWHPEEGLLLSAHDHDKNDRRDFALSDFDFDTLRVVE